MFFKSINKFVWLVFGLICSLKFFIFFFIVLFVGIVKLLNLGFLNEIIIEFNNFINNGININEEYFWMKLFCVICDVFVKVFVNV